MSHIARIELKIRDLGILKKACNELGLQFVNNQKTYKWFGKFMNDWPLPEGLSPEELGKCDHAIRVPGAEYEIGVKKNGKYYELLYDFWSSGGLEDKLGSGLSELKKAYHKQAVRDFAKKNGYTMKTKEISQGGKKAIQITLRSLK